jgi:hypothetical protein
VSVAVALALKRWTHFLAGPVDAHAPAALETAPRPTTLIVSVPGGPAALNVAETLRAAVMLTEHVGPVPLQDPPQPPNIAPPAGVAVSVTVVPELNVALHLVALFPQLIEAPATWPGPETDTFRGKVPAEPPLNVAITFLDASNVSEHVVPVPAQAPLQPVKVAPGAGAAVRVAPDPAAWFGLVQVVAPPPQLIPLPVTVPFPITDTLRLKPAAVPPLKVAVTLFDWFIETVQVVAVPPQAPVQPTNVAPVAAVATSETVAPAAKFAEQMFAPPPQLIAPLPPVTAPLPLIVTARVFACVNVAVTLESAVIVTVHVGLELAAQSPPQLLKT